MQKAVFKGLMMSIFQKTVCNLTYEWFWKSYLESGIETVPSDGDHPRQRKIWRVRNRSDMITLLMRFPPASPMISLFYLLLCSSISISQERIHIY